MTSQLGNTHHNLLTRITLAAIALLACGSLLTPSAHGAELGEQAHSLKKVPADASFYSASMRLREQWHIFRDSKAYAKLMQIPLVQIGKMQATFQWEQSEEPTIAKLREYVQSQAGQDAVAVLKEMFAEEVFVYGGNDIADVFGVFMEVNSMRRAAPVEAALSGKEKDEVLTDRMFEVLEKNADKLKVPTMVFGFRIKDQERAKRELDEVHSLLRNLLDQAQPELAAHLEREQIGGHEFLSFRADGSMLPWEKIEEEADDLTDEQFEKIKNFVSKQKLVVALGVTDEFVVLSIGESTDQLEKMGKGDVLASVPAIKRLEKHAGERVVGIQYASKAFATEVGSTDRTMDDIIGAAEQALDKAEVSEERRQQILEDIRSFDLARFMPAPGNTSAVMFLTDRGYEGFQYNDQKRPMLDSSKPLSILSHVGGRPLLLFASRSKQNISDYESLVEWLKKTALHLEKIVEDKADEEDWAKYQDVREKALVLLERLDRANRDYLYTALADGQGAFILSADAKSKQWIKQMPESPKALPMLEVGFTAAVSDAEKLRQAVRVYIDVAVEAYELIKEHNPKEMPELKLPKADVSELSDGGKLYKFPLPKKWGVDPQVAVTAGLTDKQVAVSTMPKTTERLLAETPPDLDTSLKLDRPAAIVTHIEFARSIAAVRPWIDYGIDVATGKLKPRKEDDEEDDKPAEPNPIMLQMGFVVPQVHQLLDAASALKSATAIVYEEDDAWVTHSETHFEDLK